MTMRKVLLAITGVGMFAMPTFAQTLDQSACYRVKDPAAKGKFTATIGNAAVSSTCTVKLPAKFACFESQASSISAPPRGTGPTPRVAGNFVCYQAKCPKPFPADTQMTDEFGGQRVIRFRGTAIVCAPASRGPVTFQSTTTTTTVVGATTTTVPGTTCQFDDRTHSCIGNCAPNFACAATASGGACECRSTPCGDASAPECNGFCRPDEACVFEITGCKCASIP